MEIPLYGIEAYIELITRWSEKAFELEERKSLFFFWLTLLSLLYEDGHFNKNPGGELTRSAFDGYPPIELFRSRLQDLQHIGVNEGFLVIAMRDTSEQLIGIEMPNKLKDWVRIADEILPKWMRFSRQEGTWHRSHTSYRPE